MEIISVDTAGYESNCYIVSSSSAAVVIDPSTSAERILSELRKRELNICAILLTHGHFDHILRADALRAATGAPLCVHALDAELLSDGAKNASLPFLGRDLRIGEPDSLISDGDIISVGDESILVIHTPGHTKGSVCFDLGDAMLTGDTLFSHGFGRCDLYGGDRSALADSIKRLYALSLSSDRKIYCGHGEPSTLRAALNELNFYF